MKNGFQRVWVCQRYNRQRKGHPRDSASRLRRFADSTSVYSSKRARILRAPLRAFSSACSPRPRGAREEQSAAVPAAEANPFVVPAKAGTQRLGSLLFALPSKAAAKGGRTSRVPRTRAARGIAPIWPRGQGWPLGQTRPTVANPRQRRGRGAEGAVFFGYFLLGKQKKVTGRQDGGRNTHGRESVLGTTPKIKMDSGFRRNDGRSWIPAFAGMTKWEASAE